MSLATSAPFPHSPGSSSALSSRSPSPIPPSSDAGSSSTRPPLQSKSAAFFNASWSFQGSGSSSSSDAATLNGPYRSSNAAAAASSASGSSAASSSTSLLVPPSPLLGRRASDSCLPPPCCAPVVSAQWPSVPVPTPGPSYSSRGRLASTGNIFASTSTNPWSTSHHQQPLVPPPSILTTLPDRSRSCEPSLSSPTSSGSRRVPSMASTSTGRDRPESPSSGTARAGLSEASEQTGCTSPTQSSDLERRLEAAVRHLLGSEEGSAAGAGTSTSALDTSEDDDMYYNNPAEAASTLRSASGSPMPDTGSPFIPTHPLADLELVHHPRHRTFDIKSLKRALRAIAVAQRDMDNARHAPPTGARRRRQVGFADWVDVVDAFAAVDYPGRRGPPPIERLTMRDVLELREVKIELGVFHANQPPSSLASSTNRSENGASGESSPIDAEDIMAHRPFEKMNIVETTPMSPSSELPAMDFRSPFIPFDLQDGYEVPVTGKDASSVEESADELDKPLRTAEAGSTLTSAASSYESSTPSSISLSASTSASSYYASSTISPACSADDTSLSGTLTTRPSGNTTAVTAPSTPSNRILLDPHSSHLTWEIRRSQQQQQQGTSDRDTSPESVSVSSISSPSLSLSCSPSASESDCYGYEEASATDEGETGRDGLDEGESEATYPSGDDEEEEEENDGRISREKTPTRACYRDGQIGSGRPDSSTSPSEMSGRRTKNADYFRIPLPVLPASATTIHASRRHEVDEVPLDRPWGLEEDRTITA